MLTYQDFEKAVEKGRLIPFLRDAIEDHRRNDPYETAILADAYEKQQNVTINETVRRIYSLKGAPLEDFTASNNRLASNFFRRLNKQRCSYSLGNGITFPESSIKDRLGPEFDTDLYSLAYEALEHGVCFGFWNVDKLHVFPITQFVPLWDESDGTLRAGIRYWSIDWNQKPVTAVLYEEDGYTTYRGKDGKPGLRFEEIQAKRAYKQTISHTEAGGDEIIGEENYGSLPIIPMWGDKNHQSTLVGLRAAIDAYDLIQSGFANELTDCAQLYWIIGNASGMSDKDLTQFMDRIRLSHVAVVDTDNSSVTPYTQEPPYNAREACLARLESRIYKDFGAFNPASVEAGNVTATQINAAYQAQDEEADDFEYQIIKFVQQLLKLMGLESVPQFKRNRTQNQLEQVQMLTLERDYIDTQTMLELFPNITSDQVDSIMERKGAEDANRLESVSEEDMTEV